MRILKGRTYEKTTSFYKLECDQLANYPDLFFKIGGKWLQIKASDYTANINDECTLRIVPQSYEPVWLFGTPLLNQYYSVFDQTNSQLRFSPTVNSEKADLTDYGTPDKSLEDVAWELTWFFDIYKSLDMEGLYWPFQLVGNIWFGLFGI
uniref:Peptidase A1 domain-containing protein n=1 Tax=Strombidium inclinatum TaxID=197538 RepID=A0A7S3MZM2_9SPIT|mmetsp:Transcript_32800/g.50074  ORF Transcript_32800/g.50074 Transcript_32800/m.50074 type:complete len:150 (+) Transcript_32800:1041-1490(+)